MKRVKYLLSILLMIFVVSCADVSNRACVSIKIPANLNMNNRAAGNQIDEISDFLIVLTDSNFEVQEKNAKPGQIIEFDELPLGLTSIKMIAYDSKNVELYAGEKTVEIIAGDNPVTIELKKIVYENPEEQKEVDNLDDKEIKNDDDLKEEEKQKTDEEKTDDEKNDEQLAAEEAAKKAEEETKKAEEAAKQAEEALKKAEESGSEEEIEAAKKAAEEAAAELEKAKKAEEEALAAEEEAAKKAAEEAAAEEARKKAEEEALAAEEAAKKAEEEAAKKAAEEAAAEEARKKAEEEAEAAKLRIKFLFNGEEIFEVKQEDFEEQYPFDSLIPENYKFKKIAFFENNATNEKWSYRNKEDVLSFAKGITQNSTLNIIFGVSIANLKEYVLNNVTSGEYIYVLDDGATNTIPSFNNDYKTISSNDNINNITLDYSDCTSCKIIDGSSYTYKNKRWVDTIIFPNTMTKIDGILAVASKVYVPLPANGIETVTFGSNITDSTSTYDFYFGGSLGDWCGRIANDNSLFINLTKASKKFYFKTSNNEYISINADNDLIIDSSYTSSSGAKKNLTVIPNYAFRGVNCKSITIPDNVIEIGETPFGYSTAETITIPASVTKIGKGAFYNGSPNNNQGNNNRKIVFLGTLEDWMKINCNTNNDETNGGPLCGVNNFIFTEGGSSNFTLDSNGKLNIKFTDSISGITGQFQGFKGLTSVILEDEFSDTSKTAQLSNYVFKNCSNLKEIHLLTTNPIAINSYTFSGLSQIVDANNTKVNLPIFVPSDFVEEYSKTTLTNCSFEEEPSGN